MIIQSNPKKASGDFKSLQKLTLLVPTRDRNYYLSRWLWHAARFSFGKIIIADSSSDEKKKINQEVIAQVSRETGANIQYLNCTPEIDPLGGDVFRKWGVGLQHVETEYCKMCTDKEFVLPHALVKCVDYLEYHADYVAAEGIVYTAHKKTTAGGRGEYYLRLGYPNRRSEDSPSPIERYEDAFVVQKSWNNNLLVAVTRTDVSVYLYQLLDMYSICGIRYAEILLGYVGYLIGKFYYSPLLDFSIIDFVLRNSSKLKIVNGRGTTESCASRYPHFDDYVQMGVADQYYSCYKKCMRDLLVLFSSMSQSNAEEYVETTLSQELLYFYGHNTENDSSLSRFVRTAHKNHDMFKLWFKLPIVLRQKMQPVIFQILKINVPIVALDVEGPYCSEINEVLCCIEQTLSLHETDTPILESPFEI